MGVHVLSYDLLSELASQEKIERILEVVKTGEIVLLEGRLHPDEELQLTTHALKSVSGKFSGVEIAFLSSRKAKTLLEHVKNSLLRILAKDRFGITVIGPSKIIKEIKMDPQKLEILFK